MNHWELNEEQRYDLGWTDDVWNDIKIVVRDEGARARKVRPALPLFGEQGSDPDNIFDYSIDVEDHVLILPSRQRLVAVELSSTFRIRPDQHGNAGAAMALATRAAHHLGVAEDAVLLRGQDASSLLKSVNVTEDNLDQQTKRLIKNHNAIDGEKILDRIIDAIEKLQSRGHYGDYCAIVAPDLYREAFRPRENLSDAPIYQIRPLLKENGFHYSRAASSGTGVVISPGGGTVYVTVPVDATVTWAGEANRNVDLSIVERFRLLVNDDEAIEALSEPEPLSEVARSRKVGS